MIDGKNINRRDFLKRLGLGGVALASSTFLQPIESVAKTVMADDIKPIANKKMTYRINRNTNDRVSLLGYGMMRLPSDAGVINQKLVDEQVDIALANGVNYFDTAPVYHRGKSEEATGKALSRHNRKEFFVATKLSNFSPESRSAEKSKEMYYNSFKKLQVDVIDYYLLHSIGGGGENEINERFIDNGMLDFLIEERKLGKIRNLGFSYHGDVKIFDYMLSLHGKYHWDLVQIQMNYIDWRHASLEKGEDIADADAEYLYNKLTKMNIPVVIMEPLRGGRLAKLPADIETELRKHKKDSSLASWAFRWCGSYPNVLTALSGMTNMSDLEDNIKTYSPLEPCTETENYLLAHIADKIAGYPIIPCTQCNYCMPCPFGVNIPKNFAYYNDKIDKKVIPLPSKSDNDYHERVSDFQDGFFKTLTTEENASKCRDCGVCLSKCPQKIRIPNQLSRIKEILSA